MTRKALEITGGVDTHGRTHHAAALDQVGRLLGDQEFPATAAGYRSVLAWLRRFGVVVAVGVEGTGAYGAGLARYLTSREVTVYEVDRPDRRTRRAKGKSDPIDAIAAARAVQAGTATGIPKARAGTVEAIRALRVARRGAVKARTAALNQLHGLVTSAPEEVRADLTTLTTSKLVARCARFRINPDRITEPAAATRTALRAIAGRVQALNDEITLADARLDSLTAQVAPRLRLLCGVGPQVAAQLLVTAGDNPERLRNEQALAHLCGVAPLPASSGQTTRHRLNRGGDRQANHALHTVVISRMRYDPQTRAYLERRTKADSQNRLSKKEAMRCLKRYVIREIHTALLADLSTPCNP